VIRVEPSCDRFAISGASPMRRVYYNRRKSRTRTKKNISIQRFKKWNNFRFRFLSFFNEKAGTL